MGEKKKEIQNKVIFFTFKWNWDNLVQNVGYYFFKVEKKVRID